jgi:hypothetical protein
VKELGRCLVGLAVHGKANKRAKGDQDSIAEGRKKLAKYLAHFDENPKACRENMRRGAF